MRTDNPSGRQPPPPTGYRPVEGSPGLARHREIDHLVVYDFDTEAWVPVAPQCITCSPGRPADLYAAALR